MHVIIVTFAIYIIEHFYNYIFTQTKHVIIVIITTPKTFRSCVKPAQFYTHNTQFETADHDSVIH